MRHKLMGISPGKLHPNLQPRTMTSRKALLPQYPEQSNSQSQKVEWWLPGAAGRENEDLLFKRFRVSVCDDGKVLEMDGGDGCTTI